MSETLKQLLLDPQRRPNVVNDCQQLIEDQVAAAAGIPGVAIKGGYKVVKAIKPGIIHDAVDGLLDQFVAKLEPFYADYHTQGGTLAAYFAARRDDISDALLGVTDERARKSTRATIKRAYEKLRPKGKENVAAALPQLGDIIEKYRNAVTH